jgi:uncharacterized protein YfaP (DUF2135 family)
MNPTQSVVTRKAGVKAALTLLATSTALTLSAPSLAFAQDTRLDACALVEGRLPDNCAHDNAATVVVKPAAPNTETDATAADLGPYGFSIDIETTAATDERRDAALSAAPPATDMRRADRLLQAAGVQVTFDGLGAKPRLAVATDDLRSTYPAGSDVNFRASTNYPAWISAAEIRVMDAVNPGKVIAVLPIQPNGKVLWSMPSEGTDSMVYALRVYDAAGRYDETQRQSLNRSTADFGAEVQDGPVIAAKEGEDMTARRAIPVRGGAVTVSGTTGQGATTVNVMGEPAIADADGRFVIQRILPPGVHDVRVGIGQGDVTRRVEIPASEWFTVGQADLTLGHDSDQGSYTIGRIAGYAKGTTRQGYTITTSIDTGENDLDDLLDGLDEKDPYRVLRRIDADDVYPTFGDNSTAFDDAPTSGQIYLRVERDASSLTWGDFKTDEGSSKLIRSDRTLYGLSIEHSSLNQTSFGEPKLRFTAYAAEPDRLVQRDVLRGTGGSAYFLKRQDILTGTETLYVQWRDPVSGRVVRSIPLAAGEDYDINYIQGVVLLNAPLGSTAGGQLITDRPLGRYDVNLVAQYEYVPTLGNVDGYSTGGRLEGWVNDRIRLGISAQSETTGIADNQIVGGDILWRHSELTYLSLDVAQSEGPGFGTAFSLNGGLDLDPSVADPSSGPSAGLQGLQAQALHFEGKASLEEMTGGRIKGDIAAYYDRKEAGFVSSDYDIDTTQRSWGLSGTVEASDRTRLAFGVEDFADDDGKKRNDTNVSLAYDLTDQWTAEVGLAHTDRDDPTADADEIGSRTDLGARLTWTRDDDLSVYVFGQTTVETSGGLTDNDRVGLGGKLRLSDRVTAEAEVSDGTLGTAGAAMLRYDNGQGNEAHLGYRLDPLRATEESGFDGTDGGTWVLGGTSTVNDNVSYVAENTYDLAGDAPSMASAYGVRYSPNDRWTYSASMEFGEGELGTDNTFRRRGIGLDIGYSDAERLQTGIRGEYRRETSTDGDSDRDTWLVSAYGRIQTSEDWRLIANVDALISDSDQASFRNGRYVEANLGYAYRPVVNDGLDILFRYTYLEDLPGEDQVNIDGDVDGPRQKAHILSMDANYDLSPRWTLGGKLGYRMGQVADRGTDDFVDTTSALGILRADYHLVNNWDIFGEVRQINYLDANARETGALAGVYRHFNNNLKLGVGYNWGKVSDDLRSLDGAREGVFLNIIGTF